MAAKHASPAFKVAGVTATDPTGVAIHPVAGEAVYGPHLAMLPEKSGGSDVASGILEWRLGVSFTRVEPLDPHSSCATQAIRSSIPVRIAKWLMIIMKISGRRMNGQILEITKN